MFNTKTKHITKKTVEYTGHLIKSIFLVLVAYISIVTFWGYISQGDVFLANIATLSVGGFWAFFFGYFGWRLGQSLEQYFNSIRKKL